MPLDFKQESSRGDHKACHRASGVEVKDYVDDLLSETPYNPNRRSHTRRKNCEDVLVVPPFWHVEIANIFGPGFRKGRLNTESLSEALGILRSLRIVTIAVKPSEDIPALRRMMRAHDLTSHDVLYVELAIQAGLPLGTLHRQMARAARAAGVSLPAEPVN